MVNDKQTNTLSGYRRIEDKNEEKDVIKVSRKDLIIAVQQLEGLKRKLKVYLNTV